jgi:uncharacterized protein YjbI with pentapeptide repeats
MVEIKNIYGNVIASSPQATVKELIESLPKGCGLMGADLSRTDLSNAIINNIDLRYSDFLFANLSGTRFDCVNLAGGILHKDQIAEAIFNNSDITNINIVGDKNDRNKGHTRYDDVRRAAGNGQRAD